jgi:hypothetical protein
MPVSSPRPRIVDVTFWIWVLAAILLVLSGLLLAFSRGDLPALVRGAGALFAVAGLALAYLAGRTRVGHARFRRAAVGLALALAAVLALFSLVSRGVIWLLIMVLVMIGAVLIMRPSARAWYDMERPQ